MKIILNKYRYLLDRCMDKVLYSQGEISSGLNRSISKPITINETEFKVFSQWGDDGIIDWLIKNIDIDKESEKFIEFGVENYREANTRFLMMKNNWSGLILDGNSQNIKEIKNSYYYWMYDLTAKFSFVTADNINKIISEWTSQKDIGLLHIDIDGNDYWIWEAIKCIEPIIVIIEYNALFGNDRFITVPYSCGFYRTKSHYSNLFFGASLPALYNLGVKKGYTFIGCNLAGNNAYFVRNDKVNDNLPIVSLQEGFKDSKFREDRSRSGQLLFSSKIESRKILKGKVVYNIKSEKAEYF